jgi:tRNA U34 5-methylaminomethyl-2-thiouridine-forming methyltransferase MnmC
VQRKLIITEDGSHSIVMPALNVSYHSIHGAIQESKHVFIEAGLNHVLKNYHPQQLHILEMGFGTGLNVLLTAIEAEKQKINIHYTAVEEFPISIDEAKSLNYPELLQHKDLFQNVHQSEWDRDVVISEHLTIRKEKVNLINFSVNNQFHLIYYDAFDPTAQPELWTKEVFEKLFRILYQNGILVTYCSKGDVRRAMMSAGFTVKKLPGPPGKREMLRAMKA